MRIVIAEDSVLLRAGLERLLTSSGHDVVAAVGDGDALVDAVEYHRPDLTIVDVRMPPSHTDEGLRASITIRVSHPDTAVLVLSQYVEERCAADLLADGVRTSAICSRAGSLDVRDFLADVARVGADEAVIDTEVVQQLLSRRRRTDPIDSLTRREREVLALMGEGRTNAAIADALVVTGGAVEKHLRVIFAKLGLDARDASNRRILAVLTYLNT